MKEDTKAGLGHLEEIDRHPETENTIVIINVIKITIINTLSTAEDEI